MEPVFCLLGEEFFENIISPYSRGVLVMRRQVIERVKVGFSGMLYLDGNNVDGECLPGCRQEDGFLCVCCVPGYRFCAEYVERSGASMIVVNDSYRPTDPDICGKCLRTN